jgi:hypothetical protein
MNTKNMVQMTDAEYQQLDRVATIFRTNGYDPKTKEYVKLTKVAGIAGSDALDVQNAGFMIPRALTQMVQEGIEPLLIGTSLLQRIDYVAGMQTVFPAIEPLRADEAADGADLPIYNINVAGAQSFGVTVKRHGLRLKIAKRFIDESSYPWINFWLRLAGNALARHKEEYIFDFITRLGTVIFDNSVAARLSTANPQPLKGTTTGRNYKGQFNGSMVVDDIFDMYAQVLMNGFIPDTMLVHPMAWLMWVKDPVMREFAIQSGGGSWFAQWTGNAAVQGNNFYNFGGMAQGTGQTGQYHNGQLVGGQTSTVAGLPQQQNTAFQLPNYLGLPFKILVSPFINYDPINRTTDILMFNSRNLGALIVDEDPHVKSWEDGQYNLMNMSIEETYGFGILNEGQAIAVAKNVKVRPNEFVLPARSVFNISEQNSTFQDINDPSLAIFDPQAPLDVNSVSDANTPF